MDSSISAKIRTLTGSFLKGLGLVVLQYALERAGYRALAQRVRYLAYLFPLVRGLSPRDVLTWVGRTSAAWRGEQPREWAACGYSLVHSVGAVVPRVGVNAALGFLLGLLPNPAAPLLGSVVSTTFSCPRLLHCNTRLIEAFRSLTIHVKGAHPAHSHPSLASHRTAHEEALTYFIRSCGREPYSIQPSLRDDRRHEAGELLNLGPRDTKGGRKPRCDPLRDNHVLKLVNVDYYIDLPSLLTRGLPVAMYTFAPLAPGGTIDGEALWYCENGMITLKGNMTGTYRHELWNYSQDFVTVHRDSVTISYQVDKRQVGVFALVLLTPLSISYDPTGLHHRNPLQRLPISQKGTNLHGKEARATNWIMTNGDVVISGEGQSFSVTLPAEVVAGVEARALTSNIVGVDITGFLTGKAITNTSAPAMVANYYILGTKPLVAPGSRIPTPGHSYWVPAPGVMDEEVRHKGRSVTLVQSPLRGAWVPARSLLNGAWAVVARVLEINTGAVELPAKYAKYEEEFTRFVYGENYGRLVPLDAGHVAELQNKTGQIARAKTIAWRVGSVWSDVKIAIKSFLKAESYDSIKPPRLISTLPHAHIMEWSTFTLSIANQLKTTHWYAFGRHPDAIAKIIHEKSARARECVETDYSRFDGTRNRGIGEFEKRFYIAGFSPEYRHKAELLYDQVLDAMGVTEDGLRYDPMSSRASGSAETSIGNSVVNAFVAYCTYRRTHEPEAAYGALGFYGGDDGISWDIQACHYNTVAASFGLTLKAVKKPASDPVSFLGRIYPYPSQCAVNMADPVRAWPKFNVVFGDAPEYEALANKAAGYLVTDYYTPVIGPYCRAIVRLAKDLHGYAAIPDTYLSKLAKGSMETGLTPRHYDSARDTVLSIMSKLCITAQEVRAYEDACDAATSWESMPASLGCTVLAAPPGVRVGDQEPRTELTTSESTPLNQRCLALQPRDKMSKSLLNPNPSSAKSTNPQSSTTTTLRSPSPPDSAMATSFTHDVTSSVSESKKETYRSTSHAIASPVVVPQSTIRGATNAMIASSARRGTYPTAPTSSAIPRVPPRSRTHGSHSPITSEQSPSASMEPPLLTRDGVLSPLGTGTSAAVAAATNQSDKYRPEAPLPTLAMLSSLTAFPDTSELPTSSTPRGNSTGAPNTAGAGECHRGEQVAAGASGLLSVQHAPAAQSGRPSHAQCVPGECRCVLVPELAPLEQAPLPSPQAVARQ